MPARQATVALTERLVESMDAEIREMGFGDPTLGKQVRKLVGAVGRPIDAGGRCSDRTSLGRSEVQRQPVSRRSGQSRRRVDLHSECSCAAFGTG